MKQIFLSEYKRRVNKSIIFFFSASLYPHLFIHSCLSPPVCISVANLALPSTNITKSTSVPSAASAHMSSQSAVWETMAGWLTSASAARKAIPAGLTSGRRPHMSSALWLERYCVVFLCGLLQGWMGVAFKYIPATGILAAVLDWKVETLFMPQFYSTLLNKDKYNLVLHHMW